MDTPDTPPTRQLTVADATLLGPGQIVEATADGLDLVVWRSVSGRPCVMEARCPHQWTHLGGEGVVDGEELVCLSHMWRFGPGGDGWKVAMNGRRDRKGDIDVFPCREVDGEIVVDFPSPGEA